MFLRLEVQGRCSEDMESNCKGVLQVPEPRVAALSAQQDIRDQESLPVLKKLKLA